MAPNQLPLTENLRICWGMSAKDAHGRLEGQRLADIEGALRSSWTGRGSTPFIAEVAPTKAILAGAKQSACDYPLGYLLANFPTLGVWSTLYPLSQQYGSETKDVYIHISRFTGEDFSDLAARDCMKSRFRHAAKSIGLPVSGNDPTALFFAPLGPPASRHADLANAFMDAALRRGPPAIEDTTAARNWQRTAVVRKYPNLTRLIETITFDTSAYCARRFEAWRHGEPPAGEMEEGLFGAYDLAAARYGSRREDIVGPPRLIWHLDRLALEPEPSRLPQEVKLGAFPDRLVSGKRHSVPAPWPTMLPWKAGHLKRQIPFAPCKGEVIVFDSDSGACLGRYGPDDQEIEVSGHLLVVLSSTPFSAPGFGTAIPAQDPAFSVAWVETGETLSFEDRPDLHLDMPQDAAIWIEGHVLGRDGSRALYGCDGSVVVKMDPEIGGENRILRARFGNAVRYQMVELSANNAISMPFSALGLDAPGDPGEVIFEVLAPGAAGDLDARANLKTTCWIWQGVSTPQEDLADQVVPRNIATGHSAGLKIVDGRLSVDPRSGIETPVLGLRGPSKIHEFCLSARSEKLWHCRITKDDKVYVEHGATVIFGYDNRHDTFLLRSPDREADLMVLGVLRRRPFYQRSVIEIGASELEERGEDDRFCMRRADGRIDVLARLRRIDEPSAMNLEREQGLSRLSIDLAEAPTGLVVCIEDAHGRQRVGGYPFDRTPIPFPPLVGVEAHRDLDSGRIEVAIDTTKIDGPARAVLGTHLGHGEWQALSDREDAEIAIGIDGNNVDPTLACLTALAGMLSHREPEALSGNVRRQIGPTYARIFNAVGQSRMVGAIRPVLALVEAHGKVPRHDLVGVAPWVFEAPALAFSFLDTSSEFSAIARSGGIAAPEPRPNLSTNHPVADWLERLSSGSGIPDGLGAEDLQYAFRLLRRQLRDTDLRDLTGQGETGRTVRLICAAHAEPLELMRSFDTGGGGDPAPARIAIQLERFARACATRRAEASIEDIVFRTGLSREEIGRAMTLMLRAGIEIFSYFRALWRHAEQEVYDREHS